MRALAIWKLAETFLDTATELLRQTEAQLALG